MHAEYVPEPLEEICGHAVRSQQYTVSLRFGESAFQLQKVDVGEYPDVSLFHDAIAALLYFQLFCGGCECFVVRAFVEKCRADLV